MDIATKLEILAKEIAEASYYGGIESKVMKKWADFAELCAEHKRLVQELTAWMQQEPTQSHNGRRKISNEQ